MFMFFGAIVDETMSTVFLYQLMAWEEEQGTEHWTLKVEGEGTGTLDCQGFATV